MLRSIKDRRVRKQIRDRIQALTEKPRLQGKALMQDLAGYRSLQAVEQRYRIIYRIEQDHIQVLIVAVGIRREGDKRNIYELTRKLLRLGLLDNT